MFRTMIRTGLCAVALFVAAPAFADEVKVPATPAEHFALAKQYQDKAATYRAEAQTHRDMADGYKKSAANSHAAARGQKNPQIEKAVAHCDAISATADKLATENQKAADYHTLRGKELQGK